jgi:hypothetical protein
VILTEEFFTENDTAVFSLICTDVVRGLLLHMLHPEINPVMLIICPSGRSFEVAVTNTKQPSI